MRKALRRLQWVVPALLGYAHRGLARMGVYTRHFFVSGDRDELPFDRATQDWIAAASSGRRPHVSFGTTRDFTRNGTVLFVADPFATPFPPESVPSPVTIGALCDRPYAVDKCFHISGMGAAILSTGAIDALSMGAARAGVWLNTGENGLDPDHLPDECDIIFQIANMPVHDDRVRNERGAIDDHKVRALGQRVRAFELKLSQGAKPGAEVVFPTDVLSDRTELPQRAFGNMRDLLDLVERVREVSGRPVGIKTVVSSEQFPEALCEEVLRRGADKAPDFVTVDGGEGGSGKALQSLAEYFGLPLGEALPIWIDTLTAAGLRERIRTVASGRLAIAPEVAWAIAVGADFVASARGFMLALGCLQARKCADGRCPSGVAKRPSRLFRLNPAAKAAAVERYAIYVNHEVNTIARACGVSHVRELTRGHLRVIQANGRSMAFTELNPYPTTTAP